jgi:hypothetical protein
MSVRRLLLAQASSSNSDAIAGIIVLLLLVLFLGVFIWSLVWVYADAENSGKSGCAVVLLVVLSSWPISLLLWLVSRPD